MWSRDLKDLLSRVAKGEVDPDDAVLRLRDLPFEDLAFARVDHHRHLRQGMPEAVFAPGKTPDQLVRIARRLAEAAGAFLVTRADEAGARALEEAFPEASWHAAARLVVWVDGSRPLEPSPGRVAVVAAGTSDLPVSEEAAITTEFLGHSVDRVYDVGVAGIHRLLARRDDLHDADGIIVVAGMEGALPSVVGGLVAAPVVAVPTSIGYGASFGGLAALLGMLNSCAQGVTVVNIDGGFSAACAIHRALAGTVAARDGRVAGTAAEDAAVPVAAPRDGGGHLPRGGR